MRYAKDVDKLIIDALKEKVNDLCKNGGVTALLQKVKKQRIIKARKGGAYPMQQEENYLAQSISQVDADARYDEGVKRLLANKSILAVIMKECVPEYRGCTVWEIAEKYIEGEPQIGAVGVDADETNRSVSATIHGRTRKM